MGTAIDAKRPVGTSQRNASSILITPGNSNVRCLEVGFWMQQLPLSMISGDRREGVENGPSAQLQN